MTEGKVVFTGKTSKGLDVTLRYPSRRDLHALWQFINALSAEQTFLLIQEVEISLEEEERYVGGLLNGIAERTAVQLLAFTGETLIGNTEIQLEGGSRSHIGGFGIAVSQAYRNQGVGELLMQKIYEEAVANLPDLKMVTLLVFGNNPAAIHLYHKMGFVDFGRLPGGFRHRGQFVDALYMVKTIV